jgi:threonine/homoserine/homoserine lactone efflux protein
MSDFFLILPNLAIIHIIGILQPGPNMIFVVSNSLCFDKKTAFFGIIGSTLGYSLLVILSIFGLEQILLIMPFLHISIKYVGCIYLLYSALKIWKRADNLKEKKFYNHHVKKKKILFLGFKISISNPNTAINMIAIFSLSFNDNIILLTKILCGIYMVCITFFYWLLIANIFVNPNLRAKILPKMKFIQRFLAICLVIYAIKIVF